jgi:hypothetical protein
MNVYGLVLSVLITVLLTLVFWGVIDGIVFIIEYFSLKSEYIFYGGGCGLIVWVFIYLAFFKKD